MSRVLIIGGSVGGVKTAQALRAAGYDGEIVLVEAESVPHPYDKPPLSKAYLHPDSEMGSIALIAEDELADIGARTVFGVAASSLDPVAKVVTLADEETINYDSLVIATGARARPSPWGEQPGMHVLRTSTDAERLRLDLRPGRRLLIVGAGFIGAEVAATAVKAGLDVTMVDPLPAPMSRALNDDIGRIFGAKHAGEGVNLILGNMVSSIGLDDGAFDVLLSNGTRLMADSVLVGIGAIVNTEWLEGSGLVLDNGVVCGPDLAATGVTDVYAVGDVSRWSTIEAEATTRLEHWTNAVDQALVVAHNIVQPAQPRTYHPIEYVWSDQYDWKIQIVGRTGAGQYDIVGSPEDDRFAVTYSGDDRTLTGAVIVNWPRALVACRRAVAEHGDIRDVRENLGRLLSKSGTPAPALIDE